MKYQIGQKESFSKTITETDILNFAGICGDFNPVHINKIEAEKSTFGKRIAHGALVSSFISTVLGMKLPGPGTIYLKQESMFKKPVFVDDTVTAIVEILEIDEKNKAIMSTKVLNQNDEVVIDGKAIVILPDNH